MRADCPRCDEPVEVSRSDVGASVPCPACRQAFVVTGAREAIRNPSVWHLTAGILALAGVGSVVAAGLAIAAMAVLEPLGAANTSTADVAIASGTAPAARNEPIPLLDQRVPPEALRPPVVPPPVRVGRPDPLEPEPVVASEPPRLDLPKPSSPNKPLKVGTAVRGRGVAVTSLAIGGAELTDDLVWDREGEAFFALSRSGALRRISFPNLVEDKRLELTHTPTGLAVSNAGVLVAVSEPAEVWVIDPKTLRVKARIPAPGVTRVLSGPDLGFAFAVKAGDRFGDGGCVTYLDLNGGKPVHMIHVSTRHARLTSDGKHYLAQAESESLVGYRVVGGRLAGPPRSTGPIAQDAMRICVSPDGRHACLPSGGGNYGSGGYSTFIYSCENLEKVTTIASGHYPQAVGFDPVARKIYAQNYDNALIAFDMAGRKLATYKEAGTGFGVSQFAVHPKGNRVLIVGEDKVRVAELGDAD